MQRRSPNASLSLLPLCLFLLLSLFAAPVASICSGASSCVECVMAEPFGPFSGDFCKWCPSDALNPMMYKHDDSEFAVGACYDATSLGVKGRYNSEYEVGGCMLTSMDAEIVFKGWMTPRFPQSPGSRNFVQRKARTREEAEAFCANLSPRDAPPTHQLATHLVDKDLGTVDASTLTAQQKEAIVLNSISGEILRMMRLRVVDPSWFRATFPSAMENFFSQIAFTGALIAAEAVFKAPMDLFKTAVGIAAEYSRWAYGAQAELASQGGSGKSTVFPDVTYDHMWKAYIRILEKVKAEDNNLDVLMVKLRQETEEAIKAGTGTPESLISHFNTGNKHIAAGIGRTAFYGTMGALAAPTAGLTALVGGIVGIVDAAVSLTASVVSENNLEKRLNVLLSGIFMYEATLRGALSSVDFGKKHFIQNDLYFGKAVICDITSGLPNHGCAPDHFCKREWLFLPFNQKEFTERSNSRMGICAPASHRSYPNGARCLLHSDCESGYCHFDILRLISRGEKQIYEVTARNGLIRGDEFIKSRLTPTDQVLRMKGTIGECFRAGKLSDLNCEVISPGHNFRVCNDNAEIIRRVRQDAARKQAKQSESYKKVYADIFAVSSDMTPEQKMSRWEKLVKEVETKWATKAQQASSSKEAFVRRMMLKEAMQQSKGQSSDLPKEANILHYGISADDHNPDILHYATKKIFNKSPQTYEEARKQAEEMRKRGKKISFEV